MTGLAMLRTAVRAEDRVEDSETSTGNEMRGRCNGVENDVKPASGGRI
jgi:hypothetical protein